MQWKHRYSLILPFMTILFATSFNSVAGCSCLLQHPQTHFCQAHFVAVVQVVQQLPSGPHKIAYIVEVNRIFKNVAKEGIKLRSERLYTSADGSTCGVKLNIGTTYLVSGRILSGKPSITLCGLILPWSQVTDSQREGFQGLYARGC